MAPERKGKYPALKLWKKKPTVDVYGFGMVTFQIVVNGTRPYDDVDEDIIEVKDADRNLVRLLSYLPLDVPKELRTIIANTAKLLPQERSSLYHVESILR